MLHRERHTIGSLACWRPRTAEGPGGRPASEVRARSWSAANVDVVDRRLEGLGELPRFLRGVGGEAGIDVRLGDLRRLPERLVANDRAEALGVGVARVEGDRPIELLERRFAVALINAALPDVIAEATDNQAP